MPSAQHAALGKEAFAMKGYADGSLPSAALGKGFAECKAFFAHVCYSEEEEEEEESVRSRGGGASASEL